jgi:hypothetical protein
MKTATKSQRHIHNFLTKWFDNHIHKVRIQGGDMPAKKETPVEATPETPVYPHQFYGAHIAVRVVICLFALFIGFSLLVAAFGTGFAAGRFTSRGKDAGYGMMGRGGYGNSQQYGRGMMSRDGDRYGKNGPGQGRGQCPVYPGDQSYGSGTQELPPNNAPVTP